MQLNAIAIGEWNSDVIISSLEKNTTRKKKTITTILMDVPYII